MKQSEVGKLLTIASGFDRRDVDPITIESWSRVPEIINADFEEAAAAVVAHQTGPHAGEYLTVNHIVSALAAGERRAQYQVEADVRSAKARGMIGADYPPRQPLPHDVRHALATIRERENRQAQTLAVDFLEPATPVELGQVGKEVPR
jgi:hypothetical protein